MLRRSTAAASAAASALAAAALVASMEAGGVVCDSGSSGTSSREHRSSILSWPRHALQKKSAWELNMVGGGGHGEWRDRKNGSNCQMGSRLRGLWEEIDKAGGIFAVIHGPARP